MASYTNMQIIPQDILKKYIMYSKEHIKPKLHQLDQDKLARLYADLRRDSLATGSFPITVRHLESMIRMSEASAKMHLREYVRSDDIDLAIQVTVGSFVNAQKMSIKKTLERVSLSFFLYRSVSLLYLVLKRMSTRGNREEIGERIIDMGTTTRIRR
jgi:DNA replication licensing factor MCM2